MRAEILVPVAMRTFQMSRTSLSSRMWHDAIHQLGCFAGLECLLCHVIKTPAFVRQTGVTQSFAPGIIASVG